MIRRTFLKTIAAALGLVCFGYRHSGCRPHAVAAGPNDLHFVAHFARDDWTFSFSRTTGGDYWLLFGRSMVSTWDQAKRDFVPGDKDTKISYRVKLFSETASRLCQLDTAVLAGTVAAHLLQAREEECKKVREEECKKVREEECKKVREKVLLQRRGIDQTEYIIPFRVIGPGPAQSTMEACRFSGKEFDTFVALAVHSRIHGTPVTPGSRITVG